MHNRALAETGENAVYLAFSVKDIAKGVEAVRTLGIRGVSVTLPHKVAVMDFLDEVEETALRIGAVNTLVNRNGKLLGYNSDSIGSLRALEAATPIKDRRVLVVGAGGAARAVAFAVKTAGGRITVANRSQDRGQALAADLGAAFVPLAEVGDAVCDILINTTSVGMIPKDHEIPVPGEVLRKQMVVMDIVYRPLKTLLLRQAEEKGCLTVDGLEMFVQQGACQFEWWTGKTAPAASMREAVLNALGM